MILPAGAKPPAPETLAGLTVVHAVDGDGSAVCAAAMAVEPIDSIAWSQTPAEQQCRACRVLIGPGS